MYKLRFNLSAGKYFQQWQLKNRNEICYFAPSEVTIRAYNVTLKNNSRISSKIFQGARKTVCAWLDCEYIDISPVEKFDSEGLTHLSFNPRKFPCWTIPGQYNEINLPWNLDGKYVSNIVTMGRNVLTTQSSYVIIGSGIQPSLLTLE